MSGFRVESGRRSVLNSGMKWLLIGVIGVLFTGSAGATEPATSVVERLLSTYDGVQTVQAEIRRDTEGPSGKSRRLSRVYYKRPDQIHVEGVTPPRRRIVADGTHFYSYIDGDPKGYARPIAALEGDWLISLRQIPGTPTDFLLRLRGQPEEPLPATDRFPTRIGVKVESRYFVLSLDSTGRLAQLEFFNDAPHGTPIASYTYENYQEPTPGAWFPLVQRAVLRDGRDEVVETTRLSNLRVNQVVPDPLFLPDTFFKGVVFTDNLDDIYGR